MLPNLRESFEKKDQPSIQRIDSQVIIDELMLNKVGSEDEEIGRMKESGTYNYDS